MQGQGDVLARDESSLVCIGTGATRFWRAPSRGISADDNKGTRQAPPAFKPSEAFAQLSPPAHLVLPNSPPPNAAADRTPATQGQPDSAPRSRYRPTSLYYTNGNAALLGTLRRHLQFPRLQIVAPKNQARG